MSSKADEPQHEDEGYREADWLKLRPTLLERLLRSPHNRDEVDYFLSKAARLQGFELPPALIEQLRESESGYFNGEIPKKDFYADKQEYFSRYPFIGSNTELLNVETLSEIHKRRILGDFNWKGKPLKERFLETTLENSKSGDGEFLTAKTEIYEEAPSHSLQLVVSMAANVKKQDFSEPKLEGLIKIQNVYNPLYQLIFKGEEVWRHQGPGNLSDFFLQYYVSSRDSLEFHFQYFPKVNRFGFMNLERDLISYLKNKQYKETPTFDWLWTELAMRTPDSAPFVKDGIPIVRNDSEAIREAFFNGTKNEETGPYLEYILSKVDNVESVFVPQRYIDALSAHHKIERHKLLRSIPDPDEPRTYKSELNVANLLKAMSSKYKDSSASQEEIIELDKNSRVIQFYKEGVPSGSSSYQYAVMEISFERMKKENPVFESVIIVQNMDESSSYNKMVLKLRYEGSTAFAEYYVNGKTLEYHIMAFENIKPEEVRNAPARIMDLLEKTSYDTAPLYQQIREMLGNR